MCGIAGELSFGRPIRRDAPYYSQMLQTLRRRGPDQEGTWFDDHAALLHRRLCVVDPEGGGQPMVYDGLVLCYNGELYNTEDLRRELVSAGYTFDGHSDTEVVLKAFHHWGADCAARFNGIFAFCVYDEKRQTATLARDPMGVKPLFYALRGDALIFGSELKALLAHPDVHPWVTREGLYDLLFLGPGRTPGCGIFHGVFELLPGHLATFSAEGMTTRPYWELRDAPCTDTFEEAAEKTRFLVTDAIRRQLVSDVPLATLLSGGLDSSIISAVTRNTLGEVSTYSVDYENNDRYFKPNKFQPNSDNDYIGIMTDFLRSDHTRVELDTDQLVAALYDSVEARDLPGMADVDASMLLLCRAIREKHTVVLSGECADEIFGGYPWYRDPEIRAINGFPWSQTTDYRASFCQPDFLAPEDPHDYVRARYEATLAQADILPGTDALETRMKQMLVLNLRWFMQCLLDRKDRVSMINGLEIRVPFCDKRIVEYLYTLPWAYKDYKGREKGLLRYAMRDILPPAIVERKKSPYPKTWDPTYFQAVSRRLTETVEQGDCPLLQFLKKDALLALTREDRSLPWYGQLMTTPQTVAYFLQMDAWMRKYHVALI
jgi:asparagine synthase (glutamine-hydrolysing)